jgi:enamine deaminase RidA (YjgF/YER057c/UK114 family)
MSCGTVPFANFAAMRHHRFARAFSFVDQVSLCALQPRVAVPAGHRLVFTTGQLGISADEIIPLDCEAQADLCFANIAAILAEDDMTLADVVRINAYVTDREYMQGYMRSRDRQFQGTPPASTLERDPIRLNRITLLSL